jgi:hypothetical protein
MVNDMRLGDLDVLKEMLIKERDAIPLTKTERYGFGVGLPNSHGMSMRGGINKAFRCMEKVPTIDAVPVVRCKDCLYWQSGENECEKLEYCAFHNIGIGPHSFCSYGERKEADGNG